LQTFIGTAPAERGAIHAVAEQEDSEPDDEKGYQNQRPDAANEQPEPNTAIVTMGGRLGRWTVLYHRI
jgi:hypothetical protein